MDQSPLGRLPLELRNEILELALHQDMALEFDASPDGKYLLFDRHTKNTLALTETCNQMRRETAETFYFRNQFVLILPQRHLWVLGRPEPVERVEESTARTLITLHTFTNKLGHKNGAALGSVIAQIGYVSGWLDVEDLVDGSNKKTMESVFQELQVWCRRSPNVRLAVRIALRTNFMRSRESKDMELELELRMGVKERVRSFEQALQHVAEADCRTELSNEETRLLQAALVGWREGLLAD